MIHDQSTAGNRVCPMSMNLPLSSAGTKNCVGSKCMAWLDQVGGGGEVGACGMVPATAAWTRRSLFPSSMLQLEDHSDLNLEHESDYFREIARQEKIEDDLNMQAFHLANPKEEG